MSGAWLSAFALADWIALAWFFACWAGYGWTPNLNGSKSSLV